MAFNSVHMRNHINVARLDPLAVVQGAGGVPIVTTAATTAGAGGILTVTNTVATQTVIIGVPTTKSSATETIIDLPTPKSSTTLSSTTSSIISTTTTTTTTTTSKISTTSTSSTLAVIAPVTTPTVTRTLASTSHSASATSLAGNASTSTSGGSGGLIAGIGAGIIGVAGLVVAIIFFVNKYRRRREGGAEEFNQTDFRRSAMLMADDAPRGGTGGSSPFNARPPMVARHLANAAPGPYGHNPQSWEQFGQPEMQSAYPNPAAHQQFVSFAPGQVMPQYAQQNPTSPHSAEPLFSPSTYGPSPFSPVAEAAPYNNNMANLVQGQGPAPGTYLQRQSSSSSHNSIPRESHEANYVEMSREPAVPIIHARKPSAGQLRLVNAEYVEPPTPAPPYNESDRPAGFTGDMKKDEPSYGQEDFPQPPSPSRSRIDSMPPKLPEFRTMSPSPFGLAMTGQSSTPASPAPVARQSLRTAEIQRPETVYDPEDAYGGI